MRFCGTDTEGQTLIEGDTLDLAAQMMEFPDGAIPEFGLTVVSYIDDQGDECYGFRAHGTPRISSLVGIMQMMTHDLIHLVEDE